MAIILEKSNTDNADYVDFINYVFGMNGADSSFYKLLPKLYGEGRDPAAHTYFVKDGDRLLAAVGAFPLEYSIMGEHFKVGGIGNVAVHPRARSQGYMKDCMRTAIDDFIADGYDFSILSGRRHRYAYFGYEKCSNEYQLSVTAKTVSYVCGKGFKPRLTLIRVERTDDALLDAIDLIHEGRKLRALRPRADLYDIMVSWRAVAYAFKDGDRVVGFAIVGDHGVLDFALTDLDYTPDALTLLAGERFGLCYHICLWDRATYAALLPYAENCMIGADICFAIYRWERLIRVLMQLKAANRPLADGAVTVLIHAMAGDERIKIALTGGRPTVTACTDGAVDIELSHMDAMQLFFLNDTALRDALPAAAASWMPLELSICESDNV